MNKVVIYFFSFSLFFNSCTKDQTSASVVIDCSNINSKFSSDINPIISGNKCSNANCHGGSVKSISGYSNIIPYATSGKFSSYVIDRSGNPMPPASSPQLTAEEINKIKCWKQSNYPNN
jgi:hypothetical protein